MHETGKGWEEGRGGKASLLQGQAGDGIEKGSEAQMTTSARLSPTETAAALQLRGVSPPAAASNLPFHPSNLYFI